jgi:hypothetical protein
MFLKNQSGQFVIEAVLLMTVLAGLSLIAVRTLKEGQVLGALVESPWERTSGMIETGIWEAPATSKKKVPYSYGRFYTPTN